MQPLGTKVYLLKR